MKPVEVFVSSRGNAFMTDIARWVVEAAQQAGRTASLVCDRLPSAGGTINLVVAPHDNRAAPHSWVIIRSLRGCA